MATILVVDDAPDIIQFLVHRLERLGHRVLVASDGRRGLELAAAHRPDAILMDIMMPQMTGIEVCRRLKADAELKPIPVILLTAKMLDQDVVEGLNAGAHDYVTKPFSMEVLHARLGSALRIKEHHDTIARMNAHLNAEITGRKRMERELIQAQRLEAVGHLAAGIAHELNTPAQYIGDDIRFIRERFAQLCVLVRELAGPRGAAWQGVNGAAALPELARLSLPAELDDLTVETTQALEESLEGVAHISRIVRALGELARGDGDAMTPLDLNRCIENTLLLSRNTWRQAATVETDLDPDLPPVACIPNLVGQAILNLLTNAVQAVVDAAGHDPARLGTITIRSRRQGDWAEIQVRDNGTGIREEIRPRVYDPFFTTRDVGRGNGLGLAIAHSIVVEKHGGTISFETNCPSPIDPGPGEQPRDAETANGCGTGSNAGGTTFIVRLPIAGKLVPKGDCDEPYRVAGR